MKVAQGVEWMLHCVAVVAQAPDRGAVTRRVLAERYALPEAYLAKHLKSLVQAGALVATSGPNGGYRLARPAAQISVLDILEAVDGSAPPFTCMEIRQRGTAALSPADCRRSCGISEVMCRAHQAWRSSLAAVTVADIVAMTPKRIRARTATELAAAPRR